MPQTGLAKLRDFFKPNNYYIEDWKTTSEDKKIHQKINKLKQNGRIEIEKIEIQGSDKDRISRSFGLVEFKKWSKKIIEKEAKSIHNYTFSSIYITTILRKNISTDTFNSWYKDMKNHKYFLLKDFIFSSDKKYLWKEDLKWDMGWSDEKINELEKNEEAFLLYYLEKNEQILLGQYKLSKQAKEDIPHIENALRKSVTKQEMVVYKRISEEFCSLMLGKNYIPNDTLYDRKTRTINKQLANEIEEHFNNDNSFVEPAFISTSLNKDPNAVLKNEIGQRPALLEIVVPAGIEGAYLGSRELSSYHREDSTENEFLVNKGYRLKYKSQSIVKENGREYLKIILEIIRRSNRTN